MRALPGRSGDFPVNGSRYQTYHVASEVWYSTLDPQNTLATTQGTWPIFDFLSDFLKCTKANFKLSLSCPEQQATRLTQILRFNSLLYAIPSFIFIFRWSRQIPVLIIFLIFLNFDYKSVTSNQNTT